MKTRKILIVFVLTLFLFTFIGISQIYADECDDCLECFFQDSDARWTMFEPSHLHMGDTHTIYKYSTPSVEEDYEEYFDNGKDLWGTLIDMEEVTVEIRVLLVHFMMKAVHRLQ